MTIIRCGVSGMDAVDVAAVNVGGVVMVFIVKPGRISFGAGKLKWRTGSNLNSLVMSYRD